MAEKNRGWIVTFSGTGINLALGVLYTWSVIKGSIPDSWGWDAASKALPYSVACLIFSLAMIPAGRLQDKIGPRWVATIGGILVGVGCLVAGAMGSSLMGFVIGFGVLGGIGIGFGYASATPPAVKWFPPAKTGMIAGLVVAGFGLASVYIAPLATYLLNAFSTVTESGVVEKGISSTMIVFGIGFCVVVVLLSQLLQNPPPGYVPAGASPGTPGKPSAAAAVNVPWMEMLKDPQFYVLWLMYFCGAGVGLMIIGTASQLGKASLGTNAFWAVAVLAIGNAGGRILAGLVSDRIGRQATLMLAYLLQALMVILLIFVQKEAALLLLIILLAGANYGANLSLFPSAAKDFFGLKNFGLNYGILFTAWGIGGFVLPFIHGKIQDAVKAGSSIDPNISFYMASALLLAAAALTFVSTMLAKRQAARLLPNKQTAPA